MKSPACTPSDSFPTPATFEPLDPAAYAQIVRPKRFDWYLVTRWLPDLGAHGMAIVKSLRTLCYHHRADNVLRDTCDISLTQLAALIGVNERTLLRQFKDNAALSHFVRRSPRYYLTDDGKAHRTVNRFQVSMDDPIHPSDRAAYCELASDSEPTMNDKNDVHDRQIAPVAACPSDKLSQHKVSKLPPGLQLLKQQTTAAPTPAPQASPPAAETKKEEFNALAGELIACGMNRSDARRLSRTMPNECRRQLEYLPFVTAFKSSQGAYLRTAIEQEFAPPSAFLAHNTKREREQAARDKRSRQTAQARTCAGEREKAARTFETVCRERAAADPAGWAALVACAESRLPPPIRARPDGPAFRPALDAALKTLLAQSQPDSSETSRVSPDSSARYKNNGSAQAV